MIPAPIRDFVDHREFRTGLSIGTALADAGVNILTQYSDHENQLILVVDDVDKATAATDEWAA